MSYGKLKPNQRSPSRHILKLIEEELWQIVQIIENCVGSDSS